MNNRFLIEQTTRLRMVLNVGAALLLVYFLGKAILAIFVAAGVFSAPWQDAVGTSVGKWMGIGAVMSGALVTVLQALAMYLAWRFAHMLVDVYAWFASIERGPAENHSAQDV